MKEQSIEEKAKRYDEAIKVAEKYHNGTLKDVMETIFPELKESEDEKIRAAIEFVRQNKSFNYCLGISKEQVIARLEKQGEHANFRNKIQVGDKVTRNKDGFLVNLSQLNRIAKPTNKEQKDILEDAILDGNEDGLIAETIRYKKETQGEQKSEEEVDNLHNYLYGEQKPTWSWSEEDESNLDSAIYYIRREPYRENDIEPIVNWLRNLKGRVQPQPKKEWSEEDEKVCTMIIKKLDESIDVTNEQYATAENWLEDLKDRVQPKTTWKPSEAQLTSLTIACDRNDRIGFDLTQLLKDLKKL